MHAGKSVVERSEETAGHTLIEQKGLIELGQRVARILSLASYRVASILHPSSSLMWEHRLWCLVPTLSPKAGERMGHTAAIPHESS